MRLILMVALIGVGVTLVISVISMIVSIITAPEMEEEEDVLIAYRRRDGSLAVTYDTCAFDGDGYYLENFGDFTEIEYWAEFPKAPEDPKTEEVES